MDNLFLINPAATSLDIQDAIHENLTKLRSLTQCFLIASSELDHSACCGVLWTIDSLINELSNLYDWTGQG